jgi:small nuclear ribonucleoprotein (snRNP)-like protein
MINLDETRNFVEVLAKAEIQSERVSIILDNGKEYFGKVKRSADVNYFTLR